MAFDWIWPFAPIRVGISSYWGSEVITPCPPLRLYWTETTAKFHAHRYSVREGSDREYASSHGMFMGGRSIYYWCGNTTIGFNWNFYGQSSFLGCSCMLISIGVLYISGFRVFGVLISLRTWYFGYIGLCAIYLHYLAAFLLAFLWGRPAILACAVEVCFARFMHVLSKWCVGYLESFVMKSSIEGP